MTLDNFDAKAREQLDDINYWRQLNPELNITNKPWPAECHSIEFSSSELQRLRESVIRDGYFLTGPCIAAPTLDTLVMAITRVVSAGHPPAYALLYDEFFELLASITPLISAMLGADFKIVPDEPELYFVPTSDKYSGTEPHRDSLRGYDRYDADGLPAIMNFWIPLTDSSPLNSCMYVIPAGADPHYRTAQSDDPMPPKVDTSVLHAARALPAAAGSIIGWSTGLIHWGGGSSWQAEWPRLSFAMYFQRGHWPAAHPVAMPVPFRLDFDFRLYLVEKVWRDPDGTELDNFLS